MIPRIETDRLILRGYVRDDFEDYVALWQDPDVVRFTGGAGAVGCRELGALSEHRRPLGAGGLRPMGGDPPRRWQADRADRDLPGHARPWC